MKSRHLVVACCAALAVCGAIAQTNVYRWVDKDGKVHFSDSPPPSDARESSQKTMGGGYVEREYPYAVQQAMKKNPVTLYTAPSCGDPCANGRQMLSDRGIPFSEKNAAGNATVQEELRKLIGGLEVPVLVIGASSFKGYDSGQWGAALTDAGYPATRMPGQGPTRGAPENPAPTTQPATPSKPQ